MFVRLMATGLVLVACLVAWHTLTAGEFDLQSTIAFSSSRDNLEITPAFNAAEIYLMSPDGTNLQRLTNNAFGDGFAALSPDGKKIVFDSNRDRAEGEPLNTSDLFLMNADGSGQTHLIRGSSATWSPDSKNIAFHASASGTGLPIKPDPGAATSDSEIFVANVDDLLSGAEGPRNLTNNPGTIDDDPDWSPPFLVDGQLVEKIVFTSHFLADNPQFSNTAEIYSINVDGTGFTRLTFNTEEERAPSWSPDGTRIVFMCRIGGGTSDFEICVMNADGTNLVQLTNNTVLDATPSWSPDGAKIVFHRPVAGRFQLFVMNADGTGQTQLTNSPGINLFPNWGELRVHVHPEH